MVDSAKFRRRSSSSMIWRRWVTESSSSAPQTSSDHLDRRVSNTRTRPSQSGLVQAGIAGAVFQASRNAKSSGFFRTFGSKLAVQGRYNQKPFHRVLSRSLQGVAERPLPCNYNVIQPVSAFHGGNTGSNPVGDAKSFQELTGNGHFWRRHKKAQLRRQFLARFAESRVFS